MLTEEKGVEAILFLQKLVGIEESKEIALSNWKAMTEEDREKTEKAYNAFKPLTEY